MKFLHELKLKEKHDQDIMESLLRQVEFLIDEEIIANSSIASEAVTDKYAQMIMSMPGFDYYGDRFCQYTLLIFRGSDHRPILCLGLESVPQFTRAGSRCA